MFRLFSAAPLILDGEARRDPRTASSPNIDQRLLCRGDRSTGIVVKSVHGRQFRWNGIRLRIGRHHHTPLIIPPAVIVEQQPSGLREKQDAAEHVPFTDISDEFRLARLVTNRDPKVMILKTLIGHHAWLGAREHKDPGFSIEADFVLRKDDAALRAVQQDARQHAFPRPAIADDTGGIQSIDGSMLITAHVPKRDTVYGSTGNPLQIQRPAPAVKDGYLIPPRPEKAHGPFANEDLVFVDAGADVDLIVFPRTRQCHAGIWIVSLIPGIHDQCSSAEGIMRYR